jgi:hypothetical protein
MDDLFEIALEMRNLLEKINDGSIYEETNSISPIINDVIDKFDKLIEP